MNEICSRRPLRDNEQRFRSLTQQLPVGVFMADLEGECRYVNDRWCQQAGLTAEQAARKVALEGTGPVRRFLASGFKRGGAVLVDPRGGRT